MHKRKLYLRLKGGLGNQLFIYAFGIYCEEILNFDVRFDVFSGYVRDVYGSKPALNKIGIKHKKTNTWENLLLILNRKNILNHIDYKNIDQINYDFKIEEYKNEKKLYLEGYFQNIKYFELIQDTFLDSINLDPIKEVSFIDDLNFDNSVCIHHRIEFYEYEIDTTFFYKSFEFMESIIENPIYYVFSDSIELSKEYFKEFKHKKILFVDGLSDLEDLKLMSNFKNFILTIGTFGIWSALFSKKNDKVVVRPYENVTNEKAYPDFWHKIKLIKSEKNYKKNNK